MAKRISDAERLERIKTVFPDEAEAQDILAYDKAVEASETKLDYDLSKEKNKIAQSYCRTGTREVKDTTVYKWSNRVRKPNETKAEIIQVLVDTLKSKAGISDIEIPLPEGSIDFKLNDKIYTINLIQHGKKWRRDK